MGEEGVLTGVEMNEAGDTLPRHLTLTVEHHGEWLVGDALLRRRGERHPSPLRDS
jgi:hypothetical protein